MSEVDFEEFLKHKNTEMFKLIKGFIFEISEFFYKLLEAKIYCAGNKHSCQTTLRNTTKRAKTMLDQRTEMIRRDFEENIRVLRLIPGVNANYMKMWEELQRDYNELKEQYQELEELYRSHKSITEELDTTPRVSACLSELFPSEYSAPPEGDYNIQGDSLMEISYNISCSSSSNSGQVTPEPSKPPQAPSTHKEKENKRNSLNSRGVNLELGDKRRTSVRG